MTFRRDQLPALLDVLIKRNWIDDEKKQKILDHLKTLNPARQKKIKLTSYLCNILITIKDNEFTFSTDNDDMFNLIR